MAKIKQDIRAILKRNVQQKEQKPRIMYTYDQRIKKQQEQQQYENYSQQVTPKYPKFVRRFPRTYPIQVNRYLSPRSTRCKSIPRLFKHPEINLDKISVIQEFLGGRHESRTIPYKETQQRYQPLIFTESAENPMLLNVETVSKKRIRKIKNLISEPKVLEKTIPPLLKKEQDTQTNEIYEENYNENYNDNCNENIEENIIQKASSSNNVTAEKLDFENFRHTIILPVIKSMNMPRKIMLSIPQPKIEKDDSQQH